MSIPSRLSLCLAGAVLSFNALAATGAVNIVRGSGDGEPYALVQQEGAGISVSGNYADNAALERAKRSHRAPFIWFRDHGESYLIDDRELLARADQAWQPMRALGQEMTSLGKEMNGHGQQMGKLGRQIGQQAVRGEQSDATQRKMEAHEKPMASLSERMGKLGERQGKASKQAERTTRSLIGEALQNGKAKPVPGD
ncbi:hypothetical protein [Janthinobacterium aquaticum]|uniref:hypothetical protein n=1 Tax=Janthinobacterium sp. FT58W TaxID=2654254 RepID=UPI0012648B35|nr:hypothetical protein [Janthinobacterium sp. FT58W]KAB8043048.1 hypothetical protein GCM43_10490 [Janthinobacterium sp. FT58W]